MIDKVQIEVSHSVLYDTKSGKLCNIIKIFTNEPNKVYGEFVINTTDEDEFFQFMSDRVRPNLTPEELCDIAKQYPHLV